MQIYVWLCLLKLSLNVNKASLVKSIKYQGVLIDNLLNGKDHIFHISKKYIKEYMTLLICML